MDKTNEIFQTRSEIRYERTKEGQREKIRALEKAKAILQKDQASAKKEESIRNFYESGEAIKISCAEFFKISGIYFLRNKGQIVYIGESSCLMTRVLTHCAEKKKEFDSFSISVFIGTDGERKRKEKALIRRFKPKYNDTHNSNKRRSKKAKIIYGHHR